jgi:hypothetical protein
MIYLLNLLPGNRANRCATATFIKKESMHSAHNQRPGAAPSGPVVGRLPPGRKPRGQVYVDERLSLGLNPIQLSRPIGLDFIVSRHMKVCLLCLKRLLSVS